MAGGDTSQPMWVWGNLVFKCVVCVCVVRGEVLLQELCVSIRGHTGRVW